MRRIVALLTLSLAALLAPAAQAQSASRLDDILARGVLRVGTTGDYKPFSYRPAKEADFIGLDIELAGELARTMGVKLQQRLKPQLCAVHPDAPFDFSEKAILMQRDWLFKAYVDQWLHQAIASGTLQKALDRWLDYRWGS